MVADAGAGGQDVQRVRVAVADPPLVDVERRGAGGSTLSVGAAMTYAGGVHEDGLPLARRLVGRRRPTPPASM